MRAKIPYQDTDEKGRDVSRYLLLTGSTVDPVAIIKDDDEDIVWIVVPDNVPQTKALIEALNVGIEYLTLGGVPEKYENV